MRRFAARVLTRSLLTIAASATLASAATAQESGKGSSAGKISGIDTAVLSDTLSPGDDFYLYANEKWLEKTEIPADKSNYGIFTVLDDQTRKQVRALIESSAELKGTPGSAAQKVGDLYRSVLDVSARNAAGIKPIQGLLADVAEIKRADELAAIMGTLRQAGVAAPLIPYVSVDAKNSDQYTVYLSQSGLTLPDRDYYLEDEERYIELRQKLGEYVKDMLTLIDHEDPERAAKTILDLETKIAKIHWSKTENRDPIATYNKRTPAEVDAMTGSFNWYAFAEAADLMTQKELIVRQPTYAEALATVFAETSIQQWQDYLTFHTLDAYASGLTETLEKRHFNFHDTAVSGVTEQQPLWKRGVNVTGSVLGELVGQLYVEEHFKPAAKERMQQLVDNLKLAFKARIQTLPWMGKGTKKQAMEKLSKFTAKIGYPDKWKDYSKLTIGKGVLGDHLIASAEFEYQYNLDKLNGPIDRDEWHMTPQTINAYYNPTMNEIVFPAAILQPPFFNMEADDAVNYGGIGAVIGHEFSHGFDDKGSKYDGNGNLRMWWTQEDRDAFEERAEGLVEQYNEYEPVEGNFVNGKLTLGENIGDLGGLSVAYAAYQISLDGKPADVIDGLTGDQRFFLAWSQNWRRLYREQELLRRLIVDPHSPSQYRVNGIVRNMDAWYKAFDIKDGDKLYLKEDERVRIW
ncbi:Neutral endopeptidase [Stieleria bergensis]|uniref:Neutral endopeptidase n=1 Tax=Stieleria bergensis TaxID=2528025 RepID=A0A517SS95_9BACT|nr:Neutral endopeptidase [Planctomycetes bacterium SV_7m_r]